MREPTLHELADFLNIEIDILSDAINMTKTLVSLDTPIKKDTKEMTISDIISVETMDINDLIAFKEEINKLSPFEKSLLEQSFIEAKSQSEVADMYGMNQVQVSRTLKKIKEKIKKELVA
jgi:RNA polymerase sigma factor (sigma-70 family)